MVLIKYYTLFFHTLNLKSEWSLYEIIFAGLPATVAFSGISFTTMAPAPIVTLFPIRTFSIIQTLGPI